MSKVKWIFFGYLGFVALVIAGIAIAFDAAPPRDPQTLYMPNFAVLKTLDPADVGDVPGSDIIGYMGEGLYNYKYKVHPYEIFPELAQSMPDVSPDGLTMTIKVRKGIHYYDATKAIWSDGVGPEVTAADFVYAFKRVCDFHLASANYSFVFQDRFVGLDDWWNYTQNTAPENIDWDRPVEGFKALDKYTLQLKFVKPYPQMIYNLVNCPTWPVCRAIAKHYGKAISQHFVGTGPFALLENLKDQRITLVANPIYRGRPDVDVGAVIAPADRLPHIKRVELDYFSETMPVWLLFQQGLFDIDSIPKDAYGQAIGSTGDLTPEMKAHRIVLHKHAESMISYIGFNMQDPVLGKNKPLRQAMSMAFDRAAYIRIFLNGRGVPGIGPIPPGMPTFDPNLINPNSQFNLPEARKLMVEAERINGGPIPPLSILYRGTDTLERQSSDFTVSQMRQIGVTLVPDLEDFARYQQMVDNRQTQLFDGGWDADYPDEQDYFQLFYGPNAPASGLNGDAYINPAFDALYDKAIVMNDTPERRALYVKMQQILNQDCPMIVLDYELLFQLQYQWVGDRERMMYGHGYLAYYTLDQALRAKNIRREKLDRHHCPTKFATTMLAYLVRKFLLTISIVFGVMLVTFLLFNVVAKDPARAFAGRQKSEAQLKALRVEMGLDKSKPMQFLDIMTFRFPRSMRYKESVWTLFARKAPVSLAIQIPVFIIELGLQLSIAMFVAARRNSIADYSATFLAVLTMSVPALSVYLGIQWFFGVYLKWFPVAGWGPGVLYAIHFAALPIVASIAVGLGGPIRFYRTVALEEIGSDYVRTARAKGSSQSDVLLVHVFRNLLIPVVTNTIVALPFLVTGALILEDIFQVPGFGGLLVESIPGKDSPVLMAQIYLTSIAYAVMLFVTDICYTLVDPRVALR